MLVLWSWDYRAPVIGVSVDSVDGSTQVDGLRFLANRYVLA